MFPDGTGDGADCSSSRIPPGAGAQVPDRAYGLLYRGKSIVYASRYKAGGYYSDWRQCRWQSAAALSIMARDRGEFMPKRQILIYPAVNNDYSEKSLFSSVRENGQDYLLTAGKLKDYINLYAGSEEDKLNPYFAPILEKDLSGQPDTLILTSEFDPLRDEGEAYGRRLAEAGNRVEVHRIKDALHGYFALGIRSLHVQESFEYINHFLEGE